MKKEKVKKPIYKKWWVWAIAAFIILGIAFSPSEEERAEIEAQEAAAQAKADEEKKQKEEQKKAEEEAKEKAKLEAEKKEAEEKTALIETFKAAAQIMINESNGIIPDVTISEEANYLQVNVYVDESIWARSNESEKKSFATTVGTSIENALSPHSTYVDIRSATNNDVVASQKFFGGWEIKR